MISGSLIKMLIKKVTSKDVKQAVSSLVTLFDKIFDLLIQNMKGLVALLILKLYNIIFMSNLLAEQLPGCTFIPK